MAQLKFSTIFTIFTQYNIKIVSQSICTLPAQQQCSAGNVKKIATFRLDQEEAGTEEAGKDATEEVDVAAPPEPRAREDEHVEVPLAPVEAPEEAQENANVEAPEAPAPAGAQALAQAAADVRFGTIPILGVGLFTMSLQNIYSFDIVVNLEFRARQARGFKPMCHSDWVTWVAMLLF